MAIKRPTKSRGTPLRRPVSSAAVRRVEVRSKQQMVVGEVYEGWLCKSAACGLVIALAPAAEGGSKSTVSEFDDHLSVIKCPHCGNEDLYRWNARGKHPYVQKSPAA